MHIESSWNDKEEHRRFCFNNMSGDTMVLRIADRMNQTDRYEDTIIFIIYDHEAYTWLIRGTRLPEKTFSFSCNNMEDVEHFLHTIYNNYHQITFTLLNYSNLPIVSDDITIDILTKQEQPQTIATYDSFQGTNMNVSRFLRILKSLYNNYSIIN